MRSVGRSAAKRVGTIRAAYPAADTRARPIGLPPRERTTKTACTAKMSRAPGTHTRAGRLSATRASSQIVPRIVQFTSTGATAARSSAPIAATAATATPIPANASAGPRPREQARGTSQAAAASTPSQTRTGTTGCR